MKLVKIAAAVAATVLSMAANAAPIELVNNGSFEADSQGTGYSYRTTLTGWTNTPTAFPGSKPGRDVKPFELRNKRDGEAQQGLNFVELDTDYNSNMFQNITGTGGATLSFWYMARPGTGNTNGLGVSFGGEELARLDVDAAGQRKFDKSQWQQFIVEVDFGATKSTKTLSFYALGNPDSFGSSLDNISMMGAVPEPETYALMLAGLGMMGFIARRRRATKA